MERLNTSPRARRLFEAAQAAGQPVVRYMIQCLIDRFTDRSTLLAVCSNSAAVTRAAMRAAREANAPLLLTATLNQVDTDGGYTGWTPETLVAFLREEADRTGFDLPILPCLDHGGPWLKDRHTIEGYGYEQTMAAVKHSLEACIDAGYTLLHIDPTVDRTLPADAPMPVDLVIDRTLELIAHAEAYRSAQGAPPISYEVGTEEVAGGLAEMETFTTFLAGLREGLAQQRLAEAWPCFVVAEVGTDLHTSHFDAELARRLNTHVRPLGSLLKGHYTDYVVNPEDYPRSGMGGANVGPEFTEEEYKALADLMGFERKLGYDSGLEGALRDALVASGRWKKWLRPEERGKAFGDLSAERQQWLLRTGSRYIWTAPDVEAARARLYDNLAGHYDADAYVLWRIKRAILKYYHAFNQIDFADRILKKAPAVTA